MDTALRNYLIRGKSGVMVLLITWCLAAQAVHAVGNNKAPVRKDKITVIVLHAIGGPECKRNSVVFTDAPGDAKRWKLWFEKQKAVSIHYIVDRNGQIAQSIDENRVAWHANDYNRRSIGIELVNNGDGVDPYPEQQLSALTQLVKDIRARHRAIGKQNIVRHSDIDSRTFNCGGKKAKTKQDPGNNFPYRAFLLKL